MASDAAFFEVLEADLRALCSEARKTDSLATQITGWLQHTDFPQIKECAERALLKLRAIAHEKRGIEAVRTKEILRPFLLVCESRNPRLIGTVLGSIQKLLAHNAVSDEGRQNIIQALQQVEKSSDDTVKLKILQTALTLLQNPSNADDQDGAGQVLSICMRIYCNNKSSPTVVSTASATVRQAVALLFDHAVTVPAYGGSSGSEGVALGREVAAVLLLQDLLNMCAGCPPTWLRCSMVGRPFVLDLLEFVLLHRPAAFQSHSAFRALLQNKLGPCLADLSRTALDPEVDPASAGECKLLLRCIGAMLKRHSLLLPDLSLALIETLLAGCATNRMPWQRLLALQVLRWLVMDPQVLYTLFTSYDMSIHHDTNAVHDTMHVALEIVKSYMRASDVSDEDLVAALSAMYATRQSGKEQQMDVESFNPAQASQQEVWIAYLALEILMAVVPGVETLMHHITKASGSGVELLPGGDLRSSNSSSTGSSLVVPGLPRAPSSIPSHAAAAAATTAAPYTPVLSGSRSSTAAASTPLSCEPSTPPLRTSNSLSGALRSMPLASGTVATLVDVLWRPLLSGLSCVLARCRSSSSHEPLLIALLKAYQVYTSCAGLLGEVPARDGFLASLCDFAVAPAPTWEDRPRERLQGAAAAAAAAAEGGPRVSTALGTIPDDAAPASASATGSTTSAAVAGSSAAGPTAGSSPSTVALLLGLSGPAPVPQFTSKNVHALRTLFNIARCLADVLGPSWVLVVEVLFVLDRALPATGPPGAAGKDDHGSSSSSRSEQQVQQQHHTGGSAGGGGGSGGSSGGSMVSNELLITAAVANQLFSADSANMSPDAQVSLMLALSEVSGKTLAAAQQQGFQPGSLGPVGGVGGAGGGAVAGGGSAAAAAAGAGGSGGLMRMSALSRMVDLLLSNLPRIQDLWGIFLTHVMEVLHSGNAAVRAAAIEALDRTFTGAIAAPSFIQQEAAAVQHQHQHREMHQAAVAAAAHGSGQGGGGSSAGGGSAVSSAGDVEHMLLVALESMYKEEREPDVRHGLLRITLHVLQRHGDSLSRGWVPLLRLLEAVPSWEEGSTISAAFQSVEAVSSDFLPTMPKQHLERALEVFYFYSAQKSVINISLSAIGLLWNATDLLGRSRAAAVAAAATAAAAATVTAAAPAAVSTTGSGNITAAIGGLLSALSLSRRPSGEEAAAIAAVKAATAAAAGSGQAEGAGIGSSGSSSNLVRAAAAAVDGSGDGSCLDPHSAGRSDLSEAECTELLLRLFTHLRKISMDARPEVRNSGVRTLFLAVGSQASKFSLSTWRYCLWEILFPLVTYMHVMGDTSSSQEAAAVELGREKGKAVMMLMHHSRNSEQKQWDETTVLALNGLGKVLKANLATVLLMPGFDEKWDETCAIAAKVLGCGRKSVAVAAAQLLTGFLQSYKPAAGTGAAAGAAAAGGAAAAAASYGFPWKRALAAIDEAMGVMAVTNSRVPLQARSELLTGLSGVYVAQAPEAGFDLPDMQMLLRWLDALARHPTGADDVTPVPGVLPPVQKLVLQIISHFNAAMLPDAWSDVLRTLAGFLCPFKAMQQRQQQQEVAAAAAAAAAAATAAAAAAGDAAGPAAVGPVAAAAAAGSTAARTGSPRASARNVGRLTSTRAMSSPSATDAVMLTNQWMGRICEHMVALYSHAPWQVRATLFGSVIGGLGECAALRHLDVEDVLWQQGAAGLVSVINAGLPAVNIMFVNHHQPPENAWQVLASAFETFLLGAGLPEHLLVVAAAQKAKAGGQQGGQQQQHHGHHGHQGHHRRLRASDTGSSSLHRRSSGSGTPEPAAAESKLEAAVLDSLTDVVLASCSSAVHDLRARLVRVVAAGAASTAGHACSSSSSSSSVSTAGCAAAAAAVAADSSRPATPEHPAADGSSIVVAHGQSPSSNGTAIEGKALAAEEVTGDNLPESECLPRHKRFSQMCIRKLALLAGRGTEGSAGSMNAVVLEVAQIALPLLLQQCSVVLQAYAAVEQAALEAEQQQCQASSRASSRSSSRRVQPSSSMNTAAGAAAVEREHHHHHQEEQRGELHSSSQPPPVQQQQQQQSMVLQQKCLVEEVLCVLQVLVGLQLDLSVLADVILEQQPQVAACLDAAYHAHMVHQQHQQQHEQMLARTTGRNSPRQAGLAAPAAAAGDAGAAGLGRQQAHLLMLYDDLAACVGCRDNAVGALLRTALLAVGRQLFH